MSKKAMISGGIVLGMAIILGGILRQKKVIIITGFVRKNDNISIYLSKNIIQNIYVNCDYNRPKKICSIYQKINNYIFWKNLPVHVKIDSSHNLLLDTIVFIPKSYKAPVLSFEDPNKTNNKRRIFIIDEDLNNIIEKLSYTR